MKTEPNDYAMPSSETVLWGSEDQYTRQIDYPGLTKREYFAAKALQGLASIPNINLGVSEMAECAVNYADALITTLNKSDGSTIE